MNSQPMMDVRFSVFQQCTTCLGKGYVITFEKKMNWRGVLLLAFKGLTFNVKNTCKTCQGKGFCEFIFEKPQVNEEMEG